MSDTGWRVRPMVGADRERVLEIYGEGIATGDATFATDVPSWEEWDRSHLETCRLVAEVAEEEEDGEGAGRILGWAALSPVSDRCVYGGVAEVSVYVAADARGRGVGTGLLRAVVEASEGEGLWTLQAGIFPENEASVAIHRACGFRVVGRRERLGRHEGRWRDVLLMERRSDVVAAEG